MRVRRFEELRSWFTAMAEIARLPGPVIEKWEWQYQGSCRQLDTEMFFHPDGERGSSRRRRAAEAKRICASCPVVEQCREHSISAREPYGVWGGLTEEERHLIVREMTPRLRAS